MQVRAGVRGPPSVSVYSLAQCVCPCYPPVPAWSLTSPATRRCRRRSLRLRTRLRRPALDSQNPAPRTVAVQNGPWPPRARRGPASAQHADKHSLGPAATSDAPRSGFSPREPARLASAMSRHTRCAAVAEGGRSITRRKHVRSAGSYMSRHAAAFGSVGIPRGLRAHPRPADPDANGRAGVLRPSDTRRQRCARTTGPSRASAARPPAQGACAT